MKFDPQVTVSRMNTNTWQGLLIAIVALAFQQDDTRRWDRNKEWNADSTDKLIKLLEEHDLAPEQGKFRVTVLVESNNLDAQAVEEAIEEALGIGCSGEAWSYTIDGVTET